MRDMEHQRQIIDTFVNSVYVFDDRVVLNFNFTDDSKTISREEVLGSSTVENAPPYSLYPNPILYEKGVGYVFVYRRFAFAPATNTPVGCLSNRTVCVSRWRGFATTSSEKRLLRAINKQRQGIIITVVPCLLLCIPYIARFGSIAAYVRIQSVRTYAGKRAGSCI